MVKSLLENGINSHDDRIESTLFTTSAVGGDELLGLSTIAPTTADGTIGGKLN